MKASSLVLFIATTVLLILSTKARATDLDDLLERQAGGQTDWENEDNINFDNNLWIRTLLQRMAARESGQFSEEFKRGSSKAIDHKLDKLHMALWCRRMKQQNAICK